MERIRLLLSFLCVLLAVYCVTAWAQPQVELMDTVHLPLAAKSIPFGPLPMAGVFFVAAFFAHPMVSGDRKEKRPKGAEEE